MFQPGRFLHAAFASPRARVTELAAPSFELLDPGYAPGMRLNVPAAEEYFAAFRRLFADVTVQALSEVCFGDAWLSRHRVTAIHRGGWGGQRLGGQRVTWDSAALWRMESERPSELLLISDAFSVARQLGCRPEMPTGPLPEGGVGFVELPPPEIHASVTARDRARIQLIEEMSRVLLSEHCKERVPDFFNPNMRLIDPTSGMDVVEGYAVARRLIEYMQAAIRGYHLRFERFYAAGDQIAAQLRIRGYNLAALLGLPARNVPFDLHCINLYRFEGDRISEICMHWDALTLLRCQGALLVA